MKRNVTIATIILIVSVKAVVMAQTQSCHMRELDLCAATLVVFTQSPSGLAVTENDLNKQCGYLKEADNCLKNFIRRCTTPIQRQMISFMGEGSDDLLEDYCKPGTELRKAYLKHATCLNGAQKTHQKACIKDLQVALEAMTSINAENWQKRIPIGCCSYKRFEKCIGGQVEKRCGKEALDFINLVLKRAFSRMPDMVCRSYKPGEGECAAVLPAPGSAPKGEKMIRLIPDYSHHICKSLSSVSSRRVYNNMVAPKILAAELLKKRKEDKKRVKNLVLNSAELQILGSNCLGYRPSLLVNSEGRAYLFNCGEGTQRSCYTSKVKISNLENLFVTNLNWSNVSGAYGLSLTLQDLGIPSFNIHSTDGIRDFFKSVTPFLNFTSGIECTTRVCSDEEYKDAGICVKPVILNGTPSTTKRQKKTSKLIAYICSLPTLPGALNPQRCRQLNVPIGPKLAILKSGCDITLDDGTIIRSEDVCGPKNRGPAFMVIDCPSISEIDLVTENATLNQYRMSKHDQKIDLVVHFSPEDVITNEKYSGWMNDFSDDCKHILLADGKSRRPNFFDSYRLQYLLQQIDSEIFPTLHLPEHIRTIIEKELGECSSLEYGLSDPDETELRFEYKGNLSDQDRILRASNLDKYSLRPNRIVESVEPKLAIDATFRAAKLQPCFDECLEEYKSLLKLQPLPAIYEPEVVFLGTGSALPSKLRNTSCILVNVMVSQKASIMMDCGEDSYGQLVRFYGPERLVEFFKNLKMIYISHHHADHHIGLIEILRRRKDMGFEKPVLLLIPPGVDNQLDYYNENYDDLSQSYEIFGTRGLKTKPSNALVRDENILSPKIKDFCRKSDGLLRDIKIVGVEHCANSCAVMLELNIDRPGMETFKLAYSGDARPSDDFIMIGQDCDLLIHEATFDHRESGSAMAKKHSTTSEAIQVAKKMGAKFTILTHFSQKYPKIPYFTDEFTDTIGFAFDNMSLRCPSHLGRLPIMKKILSNAFSKSLNEIDARHMKMQDRQIAAIKITESSAS